MNQNQIMDEDIDERSPTAKRPCQMATPTSMKVREAELPNNEMKKATSRSLNLGGAADSTMTVKVGGLPKLFLERNFIHCLEKLRDKHQIAMGTPGSAIVQTHSYNKKSRTVLIEFRSKEIGMEMRKLLHNIHLLNSTLTAHSVKVNEAFNDNDDGQLEDGIGFTPLPEEDIYSASTDDEMTYETEKQVSLSFKVDSNNNGTGNEDSQNTVEVPTGQMILSDLHGDHDELDLSRNPKLDLELNDCGLVPTSQVTVSNLPADYTDSALVYEIHKALWVNTSVKKPHKPIILCEKTEENVATVTFESIETASAAAGLDFVEYEDTSVRLKQVFQKQVPTCQIQVTKLPPNFNEDNLVYEISKALWLNTTIRKPSRPIVSCVVSGITEATVTFNSIEAAEIAADMKFVDYEDTTVTLKQVFEAAPIQVATCKIEVTNLPVDFIERDLVYEMHKALWLKTTIKKPDKPIVSCERLGPSEAMVTFNTTDAAKIAADMKCVDYEVTTVTLKQIFETKPININNNNIMGPSDNQLFNMVDQIEDLEVSSNDFFTGEVLSSTQFEIVEEIPPGEVQLDNEGWPIVPPGERVRNDWPTYETLKLIEGVLQSKDLVASKATQNISIGWKQVVKFMYQRKLYYSVKGMKRAWKRLTAMYPTSDKNWEYYDFVGMFLDKKKLDLEALQTVLKKYRRSSPCEPKRSIIEENQYQCGVLSVPGCDPEELSDLFDAERTLMLVAEYKSRKALFDDDVHRAIDLYKEIRDAFHTKGHKNINAEDCAKRMAYLADRYKRIADMKRLCSGTGSEITKWLYYDVMSQLFEGSAVMNPQKLFACGSSSMMKIRDPVDPVEGRHGRKKQPVKGGKNSYVSSVSTASYREQKMEFGNGLRQDLKELISLVKKD